MAAGKATNARQKAEEIVKEALARTGSYTAAEKEVRDNNAAVKHLNKLAHEARAAECTSGRRAVVVKMEEEEE